MPGTRAKAFYVDAIGFHADHDQRVSDSLRFVQLTPPGSACSIAFGEGLTDAPAGSVKGLDDPDGNGWTIQQVVRPG